MAKSCSSNIEPFWVRSSKPHKKRCFSYQNLLALTWRTSNMSMMLQFRHDVLMVSGNWKKPAPTYFNWRFQILFYVQKTWIELDSKKCTLPTYIGRSWLSVLISWWQTWCGALLILLQDFKNHSCNECEPWMDDDIGTRYFGEQTLLSIWVESLQCYILSTKKKIAVVCQSQKTHYYTQIPQRAPKLPKDLIEPFDIAPSQHLRELEGSCPITTIGGLNFQAEWHSVEKWGVHITYLPTLIDPDFLS
jgi:hypothetical protein